MMDFISVIIPCYNAANYIERCLDALQKQNFRDFNVILVDDCSTDNTVDVIELYAKTSSLKITLLRNEENAGPGVSRNRAIAFSNAEYVCFCDSDDWYDSDYLEQMVNAAQGKTADMVLCNSRKVIANGSIDIVLLKDLPADPSPRQVLALGVDSLCNIMVRRSIADEVPLPHLRNGEDMAVIPLMIMRCSKFGIVDKCIYNYLCRPGSLSLSTRADVVSALEHSFAYIITNQVPGFELEIEFIGIKNLVYGGLLNHFKCQKNSLPASQLLDRFEQRYPQWKYNAYCKTLPLFKRIFLFFAGIRWFAPLKLLCYVHRIATHRE